MLLGRLKKYKQKRLINKCAEVLDVYIDYIRLVKKKDLPKDVKIQLFKSALFFRETRKMSLKIACHFVGRIFVGEF